MARYRIVDSDNNTVHVEIHYGEEWAALYVNGKLEGSPGDAYHAEERILELIGVKVVHDRESFMLGKLDGTVAQTLDEIVVYRTERDNALAEAELLVAQAQQLKDQAGLIYNQYRR